jgi:threonine/homoserine/homoserine lactone efflux protein
MHRFSIFFFAALLLAITPGPGIFYVLARSMANGTRDGIRSSLGTFLGGMFHVLAAGFGLSAFLATSASAFMVVKYAGAGYLVYLGVRMVKSRNAELMPSQLEEKEVTDPLVQGIWTEVLNPKTALFFLSFIPQFVDPAQGHVFRQFILLGCISVCLNTGADIVVACFAGPIGRRLASNQAFRRRQRTASGVGMVGLGVYVAMSENA